MYNLQVIIAYNTIVVWSTLILHQTPSPLENVIVVLIWTIVYKLVGSFKAWSIPVLGGASICYNLQFWAFRTFQKPKKLRFSLS
jgi:hypothetical protein